jgi:hypothetical protein
MFKSFSFITILVAIVALLALILVGCTASPIQELQLALDAITAALPVIGSLTGVPAPVVNAVLEYLQAANGALGQVPAILEGPGTDAQKAAQIVALFANVAAPVVPAQYQALVNLVATVVEKIATFLSNYSSVAHRAGGSLKTTKLSDQQIAELNQASITAQMNAVKLRAVLGR